MKTISVEDSASIPAARTVLEGGGVIVYPTETAYGLGVDATNPQAVEKIFAIKGREEKNPIPIIVGGVLEAHRYAVFSEVANTLAKKFWPGPLTLVLPIVDDTLTHILGGQVNVGMRVSGSEWCLILSQKFNRPITSTSANASTTVPQYSIEGVQRSLGLTADMVDVWIDGGVLPQGPVSTVVRLTDGLEILREGAVSREDIKKVLE